MVGTDHSVSEPRPWLERSAEHADYPVEVRRKLLWENAQAFLGL